MAGAYRQYINILLPKNIINISEYIKRSRPFKNRLEKRIFKKVVNI